MNKRISFTKAALDKATCAGGKSRTWMYDMRTPGLALMITTTGAKSFYLYKWVNGAPQRIRLGSYPGVSIDDARTNATKLNGAIASGIDPRAERMRGRSSMTLAELFNHYLETHAKSHKKTWEHDKRTFERYFGKAERKPDDAPVPFPGWRNRKVKTIGYEDVQAMHGKVGTKHGTYSANRLLALLSKMFNNAKLPNPAKGVQRFQEQERERFLHADELPNFFAALAKLPNPTIRDFILVAILTGARRANLQAMQWDELNLGRGTWEIPNTKSGATITVHLAPAVLQVLTSRLAQRTGSPYVFASYGKTGHLVEPKAAWRKLLADAGLKDLRVHDLRRTLGSWQVAGGASLAIIGKSLGHKDGSSATKVYARLTLDPVKQSVNAATHAMGQFIPAGLLPAEVVSG